jgi:hypothetical protein
VKYGLAWLVGVPIPLILIWTAMRPQGRTLYSLWARVAVQARGRAPRETVTSQGRAQGDIKGEALGWFIANQAGCGL